MILSSLLFHEHFNALQSREIVRCCFHEIFTPSNIFTRSARNITRRSHGLKSWGSHRTVKIHKLFTEFSQTIVTVVWLRSHNWLKPLSIPIDGHLLLIAIYSYESLQKFREQLLRLSKYLKITDSSPWSGGRGHKLNLITWLPRHFIVKPIIYHLSFCQCVLRLYYAAPNYKIITIIFDNRPCSAHDFNK